MSLWDIIKSAGESIQSSAQAYEENYNKWYDYYDGKSRDYLENEFRKFKSGSISSSSDHGARRAAFIAVCKERGYMHD